ncbi:MAG: hypothetical protein A2020_05070 [Lentisphaerae bacterium GWF2_45_14]|nr:MAG: hypothetical protein A2020_05070 [Lentisphaerae bacterium GWF2_45_14]
MSAIHLYEKIGSDIRTLISSGSIKPEEKVPSVSEIRKKYSVSHITALRVLKELSDSGYVEFVKGKGYFAKTSGSKENTPALKGVVACILRPCRKSNFYDNYFNDINQAIQQECMRQRINIYYPYCNIELFKQIPDAKTLSSIKETCLEAVDTVDGYLLDERIPDQLIKELTQKIKKPFVVVGRKSSENVDSVAPDNVNGAKKAAELCVKMGYRLFIAGKEQTPKFNSHERTEAFLSGLKDSGIKSEMIETFDFNMLPHEDTLADIRKKMRQGIRTLLFSPHDSFARVITDVLTDEGVKLGQEVGVMGFDGLGFSRMKKPFISTIDVKPELLGINAARILSERINRTNFGRTECYTVESSVQMGDTI